MNKHIVLSVLSSALAISIAAKASAAITIRVFASDAVEKPLREIGYRFEKQHPNVKLHYEFAASGLFMASIIQGVPPDVFISSSDHYQNELINRAEINFPTTIAYSHLAAAEPCYNPAGSSRIGTITSGNLVAHLMNGNMRVGIASPVLSPAGRYTNDMFMAIDRTTPGAYRRIMSHTKEVMGPNLIIPYLTDAKTDIAILYASQIAGMRREGVCVSETRIPNKYNRKVTFSASILKPSALRVVSETRKSVDAEYAGFLTSATGQRVFKEWGFVPAT